MFNLSNSSKSGPILPLVLLKRIPISLKHLTLPLLIKSLTVLAILTASSSLLELVKVKIIPPSPRLAPKSLQVPLLRQVLIKDSLTLTILEVLR